MTEKRDFEKDMIYHVYNRGNKKEAIFMDEQDYKTYVEKLKEYAEDCEFDVLFYCLMPNHIHLCVQQKTDQSLSKLMHRLHTSYAMYFNRKYFIPGHLFSNRYKFKYVQNNEYLVYLSGYIHLNPEKIGKDAIKYPHSSIQEYINDAPGFCKKEKLMRTFLDSGDYSLYLDVYRGQQNVFETFEKFWFVDDTLPPATPLQQNSEEPENSK